MANVLKIVCPNCGASNRVESSRLGDQPKCGKCSRKLFTSSPVQLGPDNFDKVITLNEIPVVVEFWAPWCGYCRAMAPIFQQAAAQLEPRFRLAQVNTQAEPTISGRFGVQGVPTFVIFKNGIEVDRRSGSMDLGTLVGWIRYHA